MSKWWPSIDKLTRVCKRGISVSDLKALKYDFLCLPYVLEVTVGGLSISESTAMRETMDDLIGQICQHGALNVERVDDI